MRCMVPGGVVERVVLDLFARGADAMLPSETLPKGRSSPRSGCITPSEKDVALSLW